MMRKYSLVILLLAAAYSLSAEALLEYQVKAVCVLNTIRFVSWPGTAFSDTDAPLVVGILGDNPFGSSLQEIVKGETVQNRRIVIRRVNLQETGSVHVLFISNSERDRLAGILRTLDGTSVLTVSEIDRFTQGGGMVGIAVVDGKIRFQVNVEAARRAELKIGSQFLLLARNSK